jgi:transposase
MGSNEIHKQTIDGFSIRAIAAEFGVHKLTVLLTKQKVKPTHT